MLFKCPSCGYEETWDEETMAEKGEPVCPECDDDMKYVKKTKPQPKKQKKN
jgi:transcription initiation factor IIE alpha subunit